MLLVKTGSRTVVASDWEVNQKNLEPASTDVKCRHVQVLTGEAKLRAELAKIEAAYAPSLKTFKGEEAQIEYADMSGETQWAEIALQELESEEVERQAEKWGVEIDPSLYETTRSDHPSLNQANRTKVLRLVRAARRENVKWWVGIIVPILTALTGVIGSVIGVLAFLHRK